jgi:hypothetical protein
VARTSEFWTCGGRENLTITTISEHLQEGSHSEDGTGSGTEIQVRDDRSVRNMAQMGEKFRV